MKHKAYRLSLFVIFCLLQQFSFAQIEQELNLNTDSITPYEELINSIRVPEIDPRQYMIIYEWTESNEKKSRKAIKDESRLEQVQRYKQLLNKKLSILQNEKVLLQEQIDTTLQQSKNQQSLQDSLSRAYEQTENKANELKLLINKPLDSTDALALKADLAQLRDRQRQIANKGISSETKIYELTTKLGELRKDLSKQEDDIQKNLNLLKKFDYQRAYIQWQYGLKKDSSRFKGNKPFDFFDEVGKEYSGLQEAYEEYYNDIVWRNAGTPNWEPIWWLNQYPWPNTDFRNIDLVDQDYRDTRFALIPYQKYEVIDYKSTLRLVFDKNQLARNEDFKGSIGLDAFLYDGSKSGGDPREIEINPYSVIGKERQSIGLLNRPAGELADNLIVLIKKAAEITYAEDGLEDNFDYNYSIYGMKAPPSLYGNSIGEIKESILILIDNTITHLKNASPTVKDQSTFEENAQNICQEIEFLPSNNNNLVLYTYCRKLFQKRVFEEKANPNDTLNINDNPIITIDSKSKDEAIRDLEKLKAEIEKTTQQTQVDNFNDALNKMRQEFEEIRLVAKYLDYFNEEVGNTKDAFLSLIGKDKITFTYLVERIKNNTDKINAILPAISRAVETDSADVLNKYKDENKRLGDAFSRIYTLMIRLADFDGSHLDNVIEQIIASDPELKEEYEENIYSGDAVSYGSAEYRNWEKLKLIYDNSKNRKQLREYIAEKAGEILYQDLVYGTIDLNQADARDNDFLYIRMYWDKEAIKNEKTPAVDKDDKPVETEKEVNTTPQKDGVALYVAKFKLIKRGWTFATSDNAMLVDRYQEGLLRTNYPLNSNNFKLTGGASMTWGFRNDNRINKKIKFDPSTNLPKFNKNGLLKYNKPSVLFQKTFKWLEPSLGLNFSYLDFNTTRNFELGVGPSLGLFNNTIYLSGGWNLMELGERPFYFGIGASFVNLGTKVQNVAEAGAE